MSDREVLLGMVLTVGCGLGLGSLAYLILMGMIERSWFGIVGGFVLAIIFALPLLCGFIIGLVLLSMVATE